MSRTQLTYPPSQKIGGFNMDKANTNLNSSQESTELTNGSAVRFGIESQPSQIIQYNHENICLIKNKESVRSLFQNMIDNLLKFQSNHLFQGHTSEVEQIITEYEWIDMLMEIVEYGNKYVLSSYEYRIKMEA